ncbi:hypothetical protein FR943_05090 [Mycobacterium sp. TNTM28]|uniref:Uncharacterized protein n=1 Tax=[Mycobacterium] fortunisiensis TaxID=2600579 RepID=A0ABS6KI70_9MYCO|nr:hypothetical protein [[Mycobacterium] fortunisiensis]
MPGWTTTVGELALPPSTVVRPVGYVDDRGVFLGIAEDGWWLFGLDVTTGQRTFGPVRLGPAGEATDFKCYVNGPPVVLCVRQGPDPNAPSTAWVVDSSSGTVKYDGPTELHVAAQDKPRLEQVGDYAVAVMSGKGVYGVGAHGELTWFVPGDGILPAQFASWERDAHPSTLAVQGRDEITDVVFSVVDGSIVKPSMPQNVQFGRAVIYPGGFGYEYNPVGDFSTERVAFFDDTGKKLSAPDSRGTLETRSVDLPLVRSASKDIVLTLAGQQLLELPPSLTSPDARLIGSRFFVAADKEHRSWRQFDLQTGEPGETCEGESLGFQYIASDGEVAVAHGKRTPAQAIDLTTCDVLWSIAGSTPDEAKEVWKVNTTLVQRSNDRLFALVPPK